MSLTPSFSIAASSNPASFIITDTSTGSDTNVVSHQILLYTSVNALLVLAIPWPLATNPFTTSPLTQDVALNIVVQWLDINGNVLYTAAQIYAFVQYGLQFFYGLTKTQTSDPSLINDQNFLQNKYLLKLYIVSAEDAITTGSDIVSSQSCISLYQAMIQNQNLYW